MTLQRRTACLLALILALGIAPKASAEGTESSPFTVGFIGSLSGSAQIYGDAAKNGLLLALEEIKNPKFKVLYEDDMFTPSKTVAAFKKLTEIDGVDAVITVGSTPSNSVAPLAEQGRVPLVAWASDRRVSTGRSFVVRSYPSGFDEGQAVAKEAAHRRFSKVALIISQNDYAQSWKSGVTGTFDPGKIVFQEELLADSDDFRPLLLRTRKAGAEEFLVCLNPGQNGLFARQLKEFGLASGAKLGGCEYFHDRSEYDASAGALRQAWFATISIDDGFRERYLKRFGNDSVISGAACHYDLAYLLQSALERSADRQKLVENLLSLDERKGAVGVVEVSEKDGDRFFRIPLEVREVTADGFRLVRSL